MSRLVLLLLFVPSVICAQPQGTKPTTSCEQQLELLKVSRDYSETLASKVIAEMQNKIAELQAKEDNTKGQDLKDQR